MFAALFAHYCAEHVLSLPLSGLRVSKAFILACVRVWRFTRSSWMRCKLTCKGGGFFFVDIWSCVTTQPQHTTRINKIRQDKTTLYKRRHDKTNVTQDRTRQDKTGQDSISLFFMAPPCFKYRMRQNCTSCFVLSGKYTTEAFLFWRAWHIKCLIRQICGNGIHHLITAWHCFQAGWTRYFSGRTNSSEISSFSGEKKKLLLLKTDKIPPGGKSCRLPPKG